ncbi:uncharacterized protein [Miscanthus floridulus]|uniref:uncharacterized protein n=1 Tax=Miscanthus floridulus TaxID=154761 RepID=UPI003458273D
MRGFFNVLQLLGEYIGSEYSSYYADVKTELYKLFNKYESKFGAARSQRVAQPSHHTEKELKGREQQSKSKVPLPPPPPPSSLLLPLSRRGGVLVPSSVSAFTFPSLSRCRGAPAGEWRERDGGARGGSAWRPDLEYLQKTQALVVLGVINEHITFEVSPGQPSLISDDADVVALIGTSKDLAKQINQKEVHWGLLEDSVEERMEKALAESDKIEAESKDADAEDNKARNSFIKYL